MDALSKQLKGTGVGAKKMIGLVPLAPKLESNKNGATTTVESNLKKLYISPNQPIYNMKIVCVFNNAQGQKIEMDFSKSPKFFYDCQASLYSTTKLTVKDNIKLEFLNESLKAPTMFELKTVADSYQALFHFYLNSLIFNFSCT